MTFSRSGELAEKLDTMRTVETPEGVELTLRIAGPVARSLAWTIDQLIRVVFYSMAGMVFAFLGELGMGLFLVVLFLTEWFYPVVFEIWYKGATPGKMALGLAVVNDDGTPVTTSASIIRNLLRFGDFLPFFYLGGLISMVRSRDFKRLGDIVANTVVIYRDRPVGPRHLAPAKPIAVHVPLDLEEQRAIIDYAERASEWSQDRVLELAELVEPLAGRPPQDAALRLLGMAHWLVGKR